MRNFIWIFSLLIPAMALANSGVDNGDSTRVKWFLEAATRHYMVDYDIEYDTWNGRNVTYEALPVHQFSIGGGIRTNNHYRIGLHFSRLFSGFRENWDTTGTNERPIDLTKLNRARYLGPGISVSRTFLNDKRLSPEAGSEIHLLFASRGYSFTHYSDGHVKRERFSFSESITQIPVTMNLGLRFKITRVVHLSANAVGGIQLVNPNDKIFIGSGLIAGGKFSLMFYY